MARSDDTLAKTRTSVDSLVTAAGHTRFRDPATSLSNSDQRQSQARTSRSTCDPAIRKALHRHWLTALGLAPRVPQSSSTGTPFEVTVHVDPPNLNLHEPDTVVSINMTIASHEIDSLTVHVNGIPVRARAVEDQNPRVATFLLDRTRHTGTLLANASNTLTAVGFTKSGRPFWGETMLAVVNADCLSTP